MVERGGYSLRKLGTVMDIGHVIIGLAEMVLAVLVFIDPSGNLKLFPVIFLLAAVLNIATGIYIRSIYQRNTRKRTKGLLHIIAGILILVLFAISAVAIWRPQF